MRAANFLLTCRQVRRLTRRLAVSEAVLFAGSVPRSELPAYYDAANVFAMPCRTRRGVEAVTIGLETLRAQFPGLGFEEAADGVLELVIANEGSQNSATEAMHQDLANVWRTIDAAHLTTE